MRPRLQELAQLQRGWFRDGDANLRGKPVEGEVLPISGLAWADLVLDHLKAMKLPEPYLFPTPEGNLLAEWQDFPSYPMAEFDLRKFVIVFNWGLYGTYHEKTLDGFNMDTFALYLSHALAST